jgi:hypothetical protein
LWFFWKELPSLDWHSKTWVTSVELSENVKKKWRGLI